MKPYYPDDRTIHCQCCGSSCFIQRDEVFCDPCKDKGDKEWLADCDMQPTNPDPRPFNRDHPGWVKS